MKRIYKLLSNTKQGIFAFAFTVVSVTAFSQTTYTFNYTGGLQTLSLQAGTYSIAMWGANGETASGQPAGGTGGYSAGTYSASSPTTIYIAVGGKGNLSSSLNAFANGGWNGGGQGYGSTVIGAGGGGASHIATTTGTLAALVSSTPAVIIVAGGGGGSGWAGIGGNGGGAIGGNGNSGTGGNTGGTFGQGANGTTVGTCGGGGGGWFGGNLGNPGNTGGAGGGSGYIGGVASGTTAQTGQPGFVSNPDVIGNGRVIITQLCNIALGTSTGINALCQGAAVTLTTDAISSYTWSTGSNASAITVSPNVTTTYSLTAMSPSNCITSAAITISVSSAAPVLTITPSTNSVCLGNTVSIAASGALSYTFSGGINNNIPFTPLATTAYNIHGQNGCGTSSAAVTITVGALPVIAITSTNVVCAGTTATLSGGGATTYTWVPGNLVGASVIVAPQNNTTYTVTGSTGNCAGINTVSVSTNPVPSLTVTVSHFTICAGESSTLTATGALSYSWTPAGVGSSIVVSPANPSAYTVIGENSFGCTATIQQAVIVYPTPSITVTNPSPTICPGASATLIATGANTYSWSTGAGTNTISVSPAATTVYTVVGTFTNSQCRSSKTIEVNVFVSGLAITAPTAVCVGSSATLQASGADSYSWSSGGIGNFSVVSPSVSSAYTVTGISAVGGSTCSSTASVQVQANPLPVIGITASQTLICRNCPVIMTVNGATTYNWLLIGTGTTVVAYPMVQTIYTVQGTDLNGCVGTATILIRVSSCLCGANIDENMSAYQQLQISPNPSSGSFNIKGVAEIDLLLVNELGQIISEIRLSKENNFDIELRNLASGLYFLRAKTPNINFCKKIVVQ